MRAIIVGVFGSSLLWTAGALPLRAGEEPPAHGRDKAAALVRQLGDAEYTVRKQAYQELARMGRAAEAALRAGVQNDDVEVRRQCDRLLALARRSEVEIVLDAFLMDPDEQRIQKLTAWPRFRKVLGADQEARALFVAMHAAELPLLETLDGNPKEVGAKMTARCRELQELLVQHRAPGEYVAGRGTVAALLFLATDDRVTADHSAVSLLCSLLYQPEPSQWLKNSAGARQLLVALAQKRGDPATQQQLLYLFGNLRLKEGLDWAVQLVRARQTPEFNRGLALSLVGCLGNGEHLALLEPLLSDTGEVTRINFGQGQSVVQVRDVALAITIQLHGQNPGDFGFNDIRHQGVANPLAGTRPYYWPYYCGFSSNDNREAAFQKWKEYAVQQKDKGEKARE
jgi:hypothetical protein